MYINIRTHVHSSEYVDCLDPLSYVRVYIVMIKVKRVFAYGHMCFSIYAQQHNRTVVVELCR